ncbi:MAG: acyltransferase family protein [Trueperaceae bacterium]|nr:MAG: acyltransferase family protein [Trueperaceae bacterium]
MSETPVVTNLAAAKTRSPARARLLYIDNLRILLTSLVVLHHLAISYGGPGSFYYVEQGPLSDPSAILMTLFLAINQSFFMGFFFMISSYFTPGSLERKGAGTFLVDRFKRLGIPLVFFVVVISPLLQYLLVLNRGIRVSFWQFLVRYLESYRGLDVGPLWFVETLLIFSVLFVLWRFIWSSSPSWDRGEMWIGNLAIALFAVGLGLVTFTVRIWLPVSWVWAPLNLQFPHFPQYIALYLIGIVAYRRGWFNTLKVSQGRLWLGVALFFILVVFPALFVLGGGVEADLDLFFGGLHWQSLMFSLWEQIVGVSVIVFLLVWFRERFTGQGVLAKRMSGAAYTVYIVHAPILVLLVLALGSIQLDLGLKFILVAPVAVSLCFFIGHYVKKLPFTRGIL